MLSTRFDWTVRRNGRPPSPSVFAHRCSFHCAPAIWQNCSESIFQTLYLVRNTSCPLPDVCRFTYPQTGVQPHDASLCMSSQPIYVEIAVNPTLELSPFARRPPMTSLEIGGVVCSLFQSRQSVGP